jgi:hypothetical protein
MVLLAAAAVVLPATAGAQVITGEINGVVTDPTGALIPNAQVTITNMDTGVVVRTITADSKGAYTAPLLQIGTYSIQVTSPGFKPRSIDGIEVDVSDNVRIDMHLIAASDKETVTVTENNNLAPQMENAATSTVISGSEIKDLALNTRNFEQVVLLEPGVSFGGTSDQLYTGLVAPNGKNNNADIEINGQRPTDNAWVLDGGDILAHNTGQQVFIFPSIEALQEIKVLRNSYGAQYGGGGSAQIQLITKAGGSAYHGDVYFYLRNAALNANSYFNNLAGQPRPQDNEYTAGFTIGGPLFIPKIYPKEKSKTFFYYSLDIHRDAVASVENLNNVPTYAELAGNFPAPVCVAISAAGKCTQTSTTVSPINPIAQEYIKDVFSKLPAVNNPENPQGLIEDPIGLHNQTQSLVRIDHSFSARLSAFFRYVHDPIFIQSANGYNQNQGYPGISTTNINTFGDSYLIHATYALTSATVMDGGFAYQPYGITAVPIGTVASVNSPDVQIQLPYVSTLDRVPGLNFNSQTYTATGQLNDENKEYQAFGNIFHVFGRHSVSAGFNFEHYSEVVNQGGLNAGQFNFTDVGKPAGGATSFTQSLANFETGYITTFQQNSIDPVATPHTTMYEAYIQDDWKVRPRLTVNVGVRYSFFRETTDSNGHLGSFNPQYYNPTLAPAIDSAGNICAASPCAGGGLPNPNYVPGTYTGVVQGAINSPFGNAVTPQPWLNFAPRVGFAYDVFGDGKTSLRAGYGIYYDQTELVIEKQTVSNNPYYVQAVTFNNPGSFASPGSSPSTAPLSVFGMDGRWKTPYTQAYSMDIQQQFPGETLFEVAYSGNVSTHLIGELDVNQPAAGEYLSTGLFTGNVTNTNTPLLNQIRPFRGYGTIIDEATVFTANYNALQATLNKRLGTTSRISINYTWARGLTTNQFDDNGAPQDTYDIPAEYGLVAYDRRHILVGHFVYAEPFFKQQKGFTGHLLGGWELSGIATFAAGLPLTVTSGNTDPAGQGILAPSSPEIARPNVFGDPNQNAQHTLTQWFDKTHFKGVPSGVGQPGDERNGVVRGPGYQVWSLDLFKNVLITEKLDFQVHAEALNAFNHVNWTTVDTSQLDATEGTVTAARDPRELQLGVKLIF